VKSVLKQAAFVFIIFVAVMSLIGGRGKNKASFGVIVLNGASITIVMTPMMWYMQRMSYRSYLRRTGQSPATKRTPKKDD